MTTLGRGFRALACVAFGVAASGAMAQTCPPFVDVPGPLGSCPSVTWLKNRAITLGCDATHYCPDALVPRIQMAAFMNRLGNVLTPTVLAAEESGGALVLLNENIVCKTAVLPTRDYRRDATAQGSLSFEVTGQQELTVAVVSSTNGTNWLPVGGVGRAYVDPGARQHAQTLTTRQFLQPATPPREYALLVQRTGSGGLNNISTWSCNLQVTVVSGSEGTP